MALYKVWPGLLQDGRRQLDSLGHMWLLVALGLELPLQLHCGHWKLCESSGAAASTAFLFLKQLTCYSLLMLFQANTPRSICHRCETSAWLGKASLGLHQAVAKVLPTGAAELFCCLSSFIFAPSCSPVLCTQESLAPLEQLGA